MPRPRGSFKTPSLVLHKASGKAVVRIDGKDHYCGDYGTAEAKQVYDRVIAEWILRGRQPVPGPTDVQPASSTVSQLIAAYWRHAQDYYRHADGTPTSEVDCIRQALRPLRRLYGATPVTSFGPLALKALQREMAAPTTLVDPKTGETVERRGWCRTNINRAVTRIKTAFKWAVGNELIPANVYHAIAAVPGLRVGRTLARENERVMPVDDADVDAVLPQVSPQVRAMIELQRVTGMRPGEVVTMRGCDIDMSSSPWMYKPASHKTAHHGHSREIYLGPRAQEILRPFLRTDLSGFLFSPADAETDRRAARFTIDDGQQSTSATRPGPTASATPSGSLASGTRPTATARRLHARVTLRIGGRKGGW